MPVKKHQSGQRLLAGLSLSFLVLAGVTWVLVRPDPQRELLDARRALHQQEFETAQELADRILAREPRNSEATMIAAIAAAEQNQLQEALEYCRRINVSADERFTDARCMAGTIQIDYFHRVAAAEKEFRDARDAAPDDPVVLSHLIRVLTLQSRTEESIPLRLRLLRRNRVSLPLITSLVQHDLLVTDDSMVEQLLEAEPDNPGLLLAKARSAQKQQDFATAESLLRKALQTAPANGLTHARLGRVLMAREDVEGLNRWQKDLPPGADAFADTWLALGHLSERQGHLPEAAYCFREAGRRDAASVTACYRLGQLLTRLKRNAEATQFLQRAALLEEYRKHFEGAAASAATFEPNEQFLKSAFSMAKSLGLSWESRALYQLAQQATPGAEWLAENAAMAAVAWPDSLQRTDIEKDPFLTADLTELRSPDFSSDNVTATEAMLSKNESAPIRFLNVASDAGLQFTFDNGSDPSIRGALRPYDFTGGGIGVIDFDADTWPDLFLAQGCKPDVIRNKATSGPPDDLWQNIRGRRFRRVESVNIPIQAAYSQGVSVGDINGDGFEDILVGRFGRNQLLLNCGDGTFQDASHAIDDAPSRWTTSCLVADLNNDSWPDLYFVNYLDGDAATRVCRDKTGPVASCAPQDFPAAQDEVFLNDANGGFVNVTEKSGITVPNGKGLGVVASDFDGDGLPELLIANDGVPNFLFRNLTTDQNIRFSETGLASGVAVNASGISEAGMGLAVEDLDADGRQEIFVTNYFDETNTLYTPVSGAILFSDVTTGSGLGQPSLPKLGFGCQAVDGNSDGRPDLIVTNGHVDNFTARNVPYQMSPQIYVNEGNLQFRLQDTSVSGDYFAEACLGRCMVRFDWNRDGLEDLAVGSLDAPLALLENDMEFQSKTLTLQLRATTSSRFGGGSVVTLSQDGLTWTRQLNSGGGYLGDNEPAVVFAVPDFPKPAEVLVRWRSGATSTYKATAGTQYLAVEGRPVLYSVPR